MAARLEGLEPPRAPDTAPVEDGGAVDLTAALEQSVKAAKSRRTGPAAKKARNAAPKKAKGRGPHSA
ncbi:hypothetical protein ACIHCQ_31885 [Streptomyces sp. NPDC052236]|uniref:hypothetical protein n=1 Tax=Streptomyces sp. NPDC052236 TaxID=3365686 RepID=UPI0037D866BE